MFRCDYCHKRFSTPQSALEHEQKCKEFQVNKKAFTARFLALVSYYERKGLNIDVRYLDSEQYWINVYPAKK